MRRTNIFSLIRSISLASLLLGFSQTSSFAQIRYELVIPEIAGSEINRVTASGNEVNERGDTLLNRVTTFAVWNGGEVTHIANSASQFPGTLIQVNATSVNNFKQVVGSKSYRIENDIGSLRRHTFPFYWDPENGIVDLDDLNSDSSTTSDDTRLFGLNNEGVALGVSIGSHESAGNANTAFTWSFEEGRTEILPLSTYQGNSYTQPQAINDDGLVVGTFRKFTDSLDSYAERGFVYTAANGSIAIDTLNPLFFEGATHTTVRGVNSSSAMVGEIDGDAYFYDLEKESGKRIPSPVTHYKSLRAVAISETNLVAGAVERDFKNSERPSLSPFIWSEETGSVDLMTHIRRDLEQVLPDSFSLADSRITPKAINSQGQISASLETNSTFAREVILQPRLQFEWTSMTQTTIDGERGVLYRHDKQIQRSLIPASLLGYEIAFECSSDMLSWNPIEHEGSRIIRSESEGAIELFLPFDGCVFVRARLVQSGN